MNRRLLGLRHRDPGLYFGIQLAAAPFYPDYSFFSARMPARLGSDGSTAPWIFNRRGARARGHAQSAVAGAFLSALPRAGVGRVLSVLTALALASAGIGSFNAFLHPLPDPLHTEGLLSILGGGFVLLPILHDGGPVAARRPAVRA